MGYYVSLEESNVLIKKSDLDAAYVALCKLNDRDDAKRGGSYTGGKQVDRWFSWMDANYPEKLKSTEEIIQALGFETTTSENGDLYIERYDNKTGQEDWFLHAVAKYITAEDGAEPFMDWRGEDGSLYRWTFADGIMYNEEARIEWTNRTEYRPV